MFGRVRWMAWVGIPVVLLASNSAWTQIAAAGPGELVTPKFVMDAEAKLVDQEGAGKLYQVADQWLLVMAGTPAEMGFQHGRLLASRIHHIVKEGYMVKALHSRGYTAEYINAQSERMEKHFPPEYVEEMRALVKGLESAGVTDIAYEDIRTAVTQAELAHHKPNEPPESKRPDASPPPQQCSNFAAWGKWTKDGRLLHGRNLDWNISAGAQENAVILVWRPKNGIPFMMLGWTGGIGSVSGMNAKGITIGEMTSVSSEESFDGLPLMLIMRRVLEKSSTLDAAVGVIQKGPRTTGWNFVIGDGKIPSARALEADAVDCTVFGPLDPKETEKTGHWAVEDAVRRTNHPIGEVQLHKLAVRYGAEYGIDASNLQAAIPLLKMQNTWQRYDWLGKQIMARPGQMDVVEAAQLLANRPVGGPETETLHSFVFDPSRQAAYVAVAAATPPVPAPLTQFVKIDLSEWFKSPAGSPAPTTSNNEKK